MFRWFNESGYRADIPSPRALHPEPLTFEARLREAGLDKADMVGKEDVEQAPPAGSSSAAR